MRVKDNSPLPDLTYFQFEADFVESLRCIPMAVRCKLDTCGIKLKLNQWNEFTLGDRQGLVEKSCESPEEIQAYRTFLCDLIENRAKSEVKTLEIDPNPAWLNDDLIPESLVEKTQAANVALTPEQWRSLTPIQRFALIKLSRPGHESHNLLPALQEFGLIEP
jgi:hypothetical protein